MNMKTVLSVLGRIIQIVGVFLMIPAIVGVIYGEKEVLVFAVLAIISILVGTLLMKLKPNKTNIRAKEGFVITGLTWIIMSIIGAIPFWVSGSIPCFTDAVFETASGFTTTGASILRDVEALPKCMLFWRSFTHWIGGMGILVFMLAFVSSSADEMNIMRAESPGPSVEKMVPKVKETAFILYAIYTALTLILIIALIVTGMPVFDSICHAFGTAGTGGFGVKADSIASYSRVCQTIITIGMVMFGMNFNFYYLMIMKKFKNLIHSEEVFCYLGIYFIATLFVTLGTYTKFVKLTGLGDCISYEKLGDAFHQSAFQVASVMTTTGYATTDFNLWANMPKMIMVLVMFIGACAGSTGGGMKVSRWVLYFKQVRKEIQSYIHPTSVKSLRLDGKTVNKDILRTANAFLMAYIFIFVFSFIIISFDGFDTTTSFTAVTATMNNIGPGLNVVGPAGNYADFNHISKWVFIFDMIAGRLELFPILIMFSINTWRKK